MNQVHAPTPAPRSSPDLASVRAPRPLPDGSPRALSALEQLAERRAKHSSGFYSIADEYAGLDRLDRAELDE
jgi:hypothetical protein